MFSLSTDVNLAVVCNRLELKFRFFSSVTAQVLLIDPQPAVADQVAQGLLGGVGGEKEGKKKGWIFILFVCFSKKICSGIASLLVTIDYLRTRLEVQCLLRHFTLIIRGMSTDFRHGSFTC